MNHSHPRDRGILLIGATGQVGWELRRTLACLGKVTAASICGSVGPRVDLSDADGLRELITGVRPWMLVNAAAYTAVDKAESEPALAQVINADAVGVMAEAAKHVGAGVVHYSTDFVFSGSSERPYLESDVPNPIGVYGRTKLDGERQLLDSGADALILRTSWLYGARGQNFLLTMQRLMRDRDQLQVVDDQVGSPTWSRLLAEATAQVLALLVAGRISLSEIGGLYHLTCAGETSWYGFARAIWDAAGQPCRLDAIPSSEYPTPARRPAYSVLDNSRFQETFGLALPDWHHALELCLGEQAA
jgi:dTDP-4-dehydrorhamnose reductase